MTTQHASPPTVESVAEQEARLVLPRADLASLYALGRRMADTALERGLPILIQVRFGSRLVFVASLPGSTASNDGWAERKSRVVARFEKSSLLVRLTNERDQTSIHVHQSLPEEQYAAHGGAFPLRLTGTGVVGSVVVSGLPQLDDHAFVVEMLEAHLASGGEAGVQRPAGFAAR
jgi:uncharacterized protein (UPF0303 family)